MKSVIITCFLLSLSAVGPANADDTKSVSPILRELCLSSGPHFSRIIAAAKSADWAPLAADMAMAFTPVNDPIAIEGWLIGVGEEKQFEALVGFRAKIGERPVEGCTTAVAEVDAGSFEKQIVSEMAAKSAGQEDAQDTIYKKYFTRIGDRDTALTISVPRYPRGSDQVVITLVAEETIEN